MYTKITRFKMNVLLEATTTSLKDTLSSFLNYCKNAFINFTLIDAIDILFLTFILLFVFRFIRTRKAGALLAGIAVCALILFVSSLLGLRGVNFVFSGLFQFGVIAILIIFQPEIRDALERVGSSPLNKIKSLGEQKKRKHLYYTAIDGICNAVLELSESKTGALIVIEKTTHLFDIIKSGTILNADVSSQLIRNIFFNKAPLHDGAIVIVEDKIVAAGCLLPLSRRLEIDSNLGTRHRAAIGMSEASDAITIVVSEETGIISVTHDCALTRNFTINTLRNYLTKMLIKESNAHETRS